MNNNTTPKDFFLHLGATVALYAAVIALVNLSFSIINYYNPDQLASYFYGNSVVWPISMLIILVPLLYILEYYIIRDIRKLPGKESIWIRRWRIYLTLFLTGATIVGDLIALINTYLNGEISARFVYKILAVLVIAGIVFVYYLLSKTQNQPGQEQVKSSKTQQIFAWLGLVVALVAIVFGFITVGSPAKQRNLRFDSQRVSDLSNIQWQIINYWQQKGKLPSALSDLNDSIGGYNIPTDPKTEASYEYAVKTPLSATNSAPALSSKPSFELCAIFALATQDNKGRGEYYGRGGIAYSSSVSIDSYMIDGGDNWKHAAGRVCFERTIDPDKYPIIKKTQN
ncbi:MAG: DUF5671 domain-containing protein [Candidatus Paceibacterota bacterium]